MLIRGVGYFMRLVLTL